MKDIFRFSCPLILSIHKITASWWETSLKIKYLLAHFGIKRTNLGSHLSICHYPIYLHSSILRILFAINYQHHESVNSIVMSRFIMLHQVNDTFRPNRPCQQIHSAPHKSFVERIGSLTYRNRKQQHNERRAPFVNLSS